MTRNGTLTRQAAVARRHAGRKPGVKSSDGRHMVLALLDAPKLVRRQVLSQITDPRELAVICTEALRETGSLYGLYHDDPYGFVEQVIGETMWGLQREVLESLAEPNINRVAVPAGFGVGKTFLAGRATAWAGAVNPVGTIVVVTTATRERQVKRQLWPHIKTAVAKGGLPGKTDTMQWLAPDQYGNTVQVAYGFSAAPTDEAAMQGIHGTPKLMLIVDEAGGIARLIGRGTNNLLTGDAIGLFIGNPAMDDPGSWFEEVCKEGEDPEYPRSKTIRIATVDSPAITGEPTPICRACPPTVAPHTISQGVGGESHLPDNEWLHRTLREYGVTVERTAPLPVVVEEAAKQGPPYVVAKVLARFPKGSASQIIPSTWVEAATLNEDPTGEDWVRLCDLGLAGETEEFTVKMGSWVRLGVDVAADGGDEFAIYRSIGDAIHKVHVSSGAQNADSVKVAERVLEEIDRAQRLAERLGTPLRVRVKVDKNGLGWGVVGDLERWGKTGRHDAQIVGVMVSESPYKDDPAALMRPNRKRDEMWLAGRFLFQPDPSSGFGRLRLRIDHRTAAQLSLPTYSNNAAGMTVVESKRQMKARGATSPDRAEAALLSIYEPEPIRNGRRRGLLN